MATEQQVKVVIQGEDKTSAAFKSASGNATEFSKRTSILTKDVSGLAKGLAGATVAVGALAVGLGISAVKSAIEAEKVTAQLGAVLKSTGGAAGFTSKEILDYSASLQAMTTYNDEAITGAQNLLLTFTNIKGSVFKDATATILDMSTALGQDLKSSAIQVGKALNDPILGITALSRVGVSFTEQQKDQIETLVKSGQTMEAQRIILAELTREFGGSAVAAAGTFEGKILQMNNTIDDMKETIGVALIDAITPFIDDLSAWAADPDVQQKVKEIATVIGEFAAVTLPVVIETMKIWFNITKAVVGVMIEVGDAIFKAIDAVKRFSDAVKNSPIGKGVSSVSSSLSSVIKAVSGARADGGPVSAGSTYLVGERGPEFFTPNKSGFIIPNGAGAGSITINITGNQLLDRSAAEKISEMITRSLKNNMRI